MIMEVISDSRNNSRNSLLVVLRTAVIILAIAVLSCDEAIPLSALQSPS